MLRSMTGFGRCLVEDEDFVQQWEIRSVNGKHLDVRWHLPHAIRSLQTRLEKHTRQFALRGRVEISLVLQYGAHAQRHVHFDAPQASAMLNALYDLAGQRQETFTPDYNLFLSMPALWGGAEDAQEEFMAERLVEGLGVALADWNDSRAVEGAALGVDLQSRFLRMEAMADVIEDRIPSIKEERMLALRERVAEILANHDTELEEGRFLQEITLLGDKLDVSEEITRLRTHFTRFSELLQQGKDVGRKLDFTLQECFREINTCGNKIPDVQLSRLVVDIKNELEKCREQAQNIE